MRRWVSGVAQFLSVLAVAAASAWVIVSYQVARHYPVPEGVDTPSHLWRTRTAYALGLRGLFGSSPYEFHANSANPDRVGLPVLGSLLGSTVNVGPWRLMFVTSAIAAAVIAFSAWALARAVGEPKWAAPIYAAVIAVSMPIAIRRSVLWPTSMPALTAVVPVLVDWPLLTATSANVCVGFPADSITRL